MYGKKWRPVRSLTATLTGKTAELVLLLLFPCLMDPWSARGVVGLFQFSFVWMVTSLHSLFSPIYSATWGVMIAWTPTLTLRPFSTHYPWAKSNTSRDLHLCSLVVERQAHGSNDFLGLIMKLQQV